MSRNGLRTWWLVRKVPLVRPYWNRLPRGVKKLILAASTFVVVLLGLWRYQESVWHALSEFYGPDVVVGVLPATSMPQEYGSRDLLYEFAFKRGMVQVLHRSEDVERLGRQSRPVRIKPFSCGDRSTSSELYKLSVIMDNRGDRTAQNYQMTLTFSGLDLAHRDPGVRILYVGTDDLRVNYVYQQEPPSSLPPCIGEPIKKFPVSELSRQTYKQLDLTRDMAIVSGTLPAHVFQTADLLVRVPCPTRRFIVLFHIECPNCRLFYRTISLGQLVAIDGDARSC